MIYPKRIKRKHPLKKLLSIKKLLFFVPFTIIIIIGIYISPFIQLMIVKASVTITWDGGGNGTSWSDPLNWSTNVVPVSTDEVLIATAATVNITEPITVKSLIIGVPGGNVASVLNFSYDAISVGPLTINDGNLTVYPGATITHTIASGLTIVGRININVETGNANIYGAISANSKGYGSSFGPGVGINIYNGTGGGAHAGFGGNGQAYAGGTTTYGDYKLPDKLGSGGGRYNADAGGNGGGAIKLSVTGTLLVNGSISANGDQGLAGDQGTGGGAGGSIWLNVGTLTGSSTISTNGGNAIDANWDGGGGGGGRIALYYTSNDIPLTSITSYGGRPLGGDYNAQKGGAGTIFMKSTVAANGNLIIDNYQTDWNQTNPFKVAYTVLPTSLTVDNLTITKFSDITYGSTINVTNTFLIDQYSYFNDTSSIITNTLSILNGSTFSNTSSTTTSTLSVLNNSILYNQSTASFVYSTLNWTGGKLVDNGGTLALLSGGGDLTVPATSTLDSNVARSYSNVIVNGLLTHSFNSSTESYKINYTVSGNMTINSTGSVNASSKGFGSSFGPGVGVNIYNGTGGGAHAGFGGNGQAYAGGTTTYGDYKLPDKLGSGGGRYNADAGGNGGGAIKLSVTGTLLVNGSISANGDQGITGDQGTGGGAGGSIWLNVGALTGSSTISTNGGNAIDANWDGGGGGGGRIALYYTNNDIPLTSITSYGGRPLGGNYTVQKGGAGTIFMKSTVAANGNLIIDNYQTDWYQTDPFKVAYTVLPTNLTVDNLTITRYSDITYGSTINVANTFLIDQYSYFNDTSSTTTSTLSVLNNSILYNQSTASFVYSTLNWTGGKLVDNGGTFALLSGGGDLTVPATSTLDSNVARSYSNVIVNGLLTHSFNSSAESYKINYTVSGNMTINSTGSVNASSKGFGSSYGPGVGVNIYNGTGGGAHAGFGGNGQAYAGGTTTYGDYKLPDKLGSGGGRYIADAGGNGGGAIKLSVTGTLLVNGSISANGDQGITGDQGTGGGAGGSIWLNVGALTGSSTISTNGGNAIDANWDGGGGGGGRIALYYTNNDIPLTSITSYGGRPLGGNYTVQKGGAGTIFMKSTVAANGNLIIDNYQTDWYQTDPFKVAYTVLPTNFTVDNLTVTKFSDITYGSTINVTNTFLIDQYSYFSSTGSTTTNTLSVLNNSILYNQSTASFVYSTLNWTGAGLVDNGGTFAFLSGGGDLTVPATSTLESNVPRSYTNVTINGLLTHNANTTAESYKINFTVSGNTTVNAGGSINANGKGFSMGNGPGAGVSGTVGAGGGSYGGVGGDGQYRAGSLVIYGNQLAPDRLGSGGGKYDYSTSSGSGGGAIKIYSKGNLVVNGTIYANGTHSVVDWNHPPGGGSGGSIWLVGNNVSGSGSITANGANTPDTNYDGGAGGGGRIAIYYVTNSSGLAALTANKGIASGAGAKSGGNGTVYLGGITADPVNLRQYKIDGVTAIAQGGITSESSIVTTLQVQDGDLTDTLTPQVEIKPVGTAFNNVPTDVGTPVAYNGSIITASVSVVGLANNESYHWQARVCDASSNCTGWISYGSNLESEADISIVTNADPNSPLIPDSSFFINGQYTNSLQPTLGFVLSDPNNTDSVQYRIQLAADNTFNTLILDYSSEFAAQGTRLYSIGQTTGTGVYHTGNEDMQLAEGNYYWKVQTIDDKEGESGWSVAPGTPSFRIDLSKPSNATYAFMKPYKDAINQYNYDDPPLWFNRNDLFFSWQEGTDLQGVKGYCLYLGPKSDGNPATEKGILGTSPISTTGSDCQFITDTTEIDFANPSYRGSDWLTSSMDRYFFKIKTIDISNNVFEGPDDSNVVPLYFDNTLPQNVTAISAASGTFSSTAEMYFNWPIVAGQNGSDEHSGLLGFQYSLNSKNIEDWIGDVVDDHTSLSYSLMTKSQPVYFPEAVQNLVQIGQNIIYFRTIDRAGNFSELRTAYINYGGEAPKFAQGEEVRVVPTQNNINRFAFEWNAAIPSDGNAIKSYYYMLNTVPPASYATIISNSATYRPTNDTNVPEANFAGLRRGANTIHVIAVDTLDNYSPTNFITATFFLNSDLPDPVNNLTVSDSSIKDASIWRVALVWDLPDYRGTGDLTYHIERSENSTDWSEIDSTTGLAYIDVVGESKRYYWRVSTTDTSDQSIATPSYTNAVSIIPKGSYTTPPTLTSGPASSSITTTTALITWTTNRTGDSKVAFGLAPSNYFDSETYKSSHVTEHKIQLSNLTPGTTYYFTAKWTDEDGNTGISEEQSFTTAPPPQVKDVRLSNLGISSVMVNFTTINANKARIYYGTSTSFGGIKDIGTSKLETAYTIELNQLNDGTKYYYKINTFDEENKEYEGTILDFTTLPRPRVSEIVVQQVINTAQSTLLVTWQSNTLVTSVVTFYPEANEELARDIVELKLVKGEHKILIKGLFPQMAYVIRVSGKDIIGNEAVSDPIRIITATDSRAPYISAMTIEGSNTTQMSGVSPNTSSQLIVSWTTDEPSTSQVEFGEGSGITYNQLTQEDTDLSYNHVVIVSGLTPSKVYHVRSISKDAAGNVSKSIDTLTITPKATDNAFDMVITILRESFGFLTK